MYGRRVIAAAILFASIYAAIGCIALKIAYRVVFREYSMEIGQAFKYMFGVGLISFVALIIANVAMSGASGAASAQTPPLAALLIAIGVNYFGTVWVLIRYEGLVLGQSLGVSLITTGLFVVEILAIWFAFTAADAVNSAS